MEHPGNYMENECVSNGLGKGVGEQNEPQRGSVTVPKRLLPMTGRLAGATHDKRAVSPLG